MVKQTSKKIKEELKKVKVINLPNLKELFFHPTKFLNSIENQKNYEPILRGFIVLYLFYFIISSIQVLIFNGFDTVFIIRSLLNTILLSIACPFIISGVTHLGVILFKGKEKFFNTFKPVTYALMISLIYSFIIIILFTIIKLTMPFNTTMLTTIQPDSDPALVAQIYSDFFAQKGAIISIIVTIILFVIMTIHELFFMIKGIGKFQKLSKIKAGLAIIIPWVILLVIFVLLIILIGYSV